MQFYTPCKRWKTFGLLTFSEVIEMNIGLKWVKASSPLHHRDFGENS